MAAPLIGLEWVGGDNFVWGMQESSFSDARLANQTRKQNLENLSCLGSRLMRVQLLE